MFQVEIIRNVVESYMKIVVKTTRDLVPKTITMLMINTMKDFIKAELLAHIYASEDAEAMMEESAEEVTRRENVVRMYQACKEALRIIGEVNVSMATDSTRTSSPSRSRIGPRLRQSSRTTPTRAPPLPPVTQPSAPDHPNPSSSFSRSVTVVH